jgi:FkbM family methyltransferase
LINRVANMASLKVVTMGTPNRDFDAVLGHLRRLDIRFRTVIDVGIAFGTPALYRNCPGANFYFIEPVPTCKPVLDALVRAHGGQAFNVAAGAQDGTVEFFVHPDTSGSSTRRQLEGEFFDGQRVSVPVRRLDSMVTLPLARPSLLKIDTQGAELDVLAGAGAVLDQIDVIIIEVSFHQFRDAAPEFDEVVTRMAQLEFRTYETLEGHYRAADNAQAQVDIAFVRHDSALRRTKTFFTAEQAEQYLRQP